MASNNLNLTFETLFDITRREKMQEDIQKLEPNFFNNLIIYINEKSKILEKDTKSNVFARDEKQITRKQLENIRRLIQELYARRERKIVNLAIIKSRTNSKLIDTSSLLSEEKSLFLFLLQLLNHSKKNILYNLLQGKMPFSLDVSVCFNIGNNIKNTTSEGNLTKLREDESDTLESNTAENSSSSNLLNNDVLNNENVSNNIKSNISDNSDSNKTKPDIVNKTIKFLGTVPKFIGKELEVYGPFEKEDIASLPDEIAKVLISKGRAQEIKQT